MLLSTDPNPRTAPRPAAAAAPRADTPAWTDKQTCAPRTVAEVVAVVNWAHRNGWRVRTTGLRGIRHGSSPPTRAPVPPRTLLIDLSQHMNRARIDPTGADRGGPASVTALTGITMESLLTHLEHAGYGVATCPATGDMTLGEALAIGAHGTAVPADGEMPRPGHTYGSLSNLIISLTVVVWDATQQAYVARTVRRNDPRIGALLVHLGRAMVVAATLRVGPLQHLRCISRTDLSVATVFAPADVAGSQSFAALLKRFGRVESRWFPFTPAPWLKAWSVAPERPATSREIDAPYNYPFTEEIGEEQSALLRELAEGNTWVTPLFTGLAYASAVAGLRATASVDLWGTAKNTLVYARPSALRITAGKYVVLTTRDRVQHVVSTFYDYLSETLERHRAEDRFPVNGPWDVRVTGLDDLADCGVTDAQPAHLSPTRRPAGRAFDTAVWLTVRTLTGTADSLHFYAQLDAWIQATFTDPHETVRTIRFEQPEPPSDDPPADDDAWAAAMTTLTRLDPHRVYSGSRG